MRVPFFVNRLPLMPTTTPYPERGLSISELLGDPSDTTWHRVIAANYMIDFEWLLRAAPILRTVGDLIILSGEKTNTHIYAAAAAVGMRPPTVVVPPLPLPYGTHHTKCLICFGEHGARVVVCTANFICDDWERKNQGIYVQDFPRRQRIAAAGGGRGGGIGGGTVVGGTAAAAPQQHNDFSCVLGDYLRKSGVAAPVVEELCGEYDFSNAAVDLVPSVPGYHKSAAMDAYGLCRLEKVLARLEEVQPSTSSSLTWQYSSQGSLNTAFLKDLTTAMLGPKGQPLVERAHISVHFPTETQVRESLEGWRGGSSIPVHVKNCHEFVNHRLHRWGHPRNSNLGDHPRNHAMPHIKSYARFDRPSGALDWFLLTSANLSRAAWGERQKSNTQLQIRSFELGVLFHPARLAQWWAHTSHNGGMFWCGRTPPGGRLPPESAVAHEEGEGERSGGLKVHAFRPATTASGCVATFCIALPYDVVHADPYESTKQLHDPRRPRTLPLSCRDVPWVLDVPHRGVDCFGSTIDELAAYSHYGPTSWNAPTKHYETWRKVSPKCDERLQRLRGDEPRLPVVVIDVDEEDAKAEHATSVLTSTEPRIKRLREEEVIDEPHVRATRNVCS